MFPFLNIGSCNAENCSPKAVQERKLKFLKWMRDDLESKVAGLNAMIETIERQINREEVTES